MEQSLDSARWRKVLEVRGMLRAYNQALQEQAKLARLSNKLMKGQEGTNIAHYGKAGFKRIARAVNVMPIGVLGLYLIKSPLTRLAAIVGFSAAFLLALALFTKARLVEVFAATTAFASVQVVFVGGQSVRQVRVYRDRCQ
ncbi:hypothetical protein BU26DRAFT_573045 [Trematosphaeria pertusa]|uniref:DUF6594 domain-containing protein n=1 Tax=Trematosphaeria pertusa TaxID=390896 RepID=A0A6A6HQX3_9PLEO|nr:uncharacterized protein BU26DRAFT_573045 [Trematosphaeria pertusa]KAF2240198.1 hypothetical protein BU26DRAFT_573045 [Trematosphaeria pertusa]